MENGCFHIECFLQQEEKIKHGTDDGNFATLLANQEWYCQRKPIKIHAWQLIGSLRHFRSAVISSSFCSYSSSSQSSQLTFVIPKQPSFSLSHLYPMFSRRARNTEKILSIHRTKEKKKTTTKKREIAWIRNT